MIKVYTSEDLIYLYHIKNVLQAQGIETVIRNDRLSSLAGELPITVCWPELWLIDPLKELWAIELIEESRLDADTNKNWICKNCGEEHSSRFTDCWNCQRIKAF